jgi:diguanylate cyclase (GGDEF)-like protein
VNFDETQVRTTMRPSPGKDGASAILTCVRATDTVAHLGGDEFVILLTDIEQTGDAEQVAEKALGCCSALKKRRAPGHEVTLRIGISIYPDDGKSAAELMQCADTAMYQAKVLGRNHCRSFYESTKR